MRGKLGKKGKRLPSRKKKDVQRRKSKGRRREKEQSPGASRSPDSQKYAAKVQASAISGRRLWLFRIIAVFGVPALFLLFVEVVLRVVGYGFPAAAVVECQSSGEDAYCDNARFSFRFFPKAIAREFDPFIFPADKPDDTYRVFVLGASAAQGTPDGAFSFGRVLRVMMQDKYPGVNFEVVTAAMAAVNSHVVLEIAKDCARHEPDLFIIYLGNNEVVGPYGAGTIFAPLSGNLSLIRAGVALKATRLGQALGDLVGLIAGKDAPVVWRGLEMFLDNQVRADDTALETVYGHFHSNLEDIVGAARAGGAQVAVCTVGSNLKDCPPFTSLHRADLTEADKKNWDEVYREGAEYETADKWAEAIGRYNEAAGIDNSFAALQFRLGRCYWAMGEYNMAREKYIRARELDTLRIRADSRINRIIRDVAGGGAGGVYLVDAVEAFEHGSPHGTPGNELFYEHVHLNFAGNYVLAGTVFGRIEEILPQRIRRLKAGEGGVITEEECAQRLAYSNIDNHRIASEVLNTYIRKAPFTNQLYHKERVEQMEVHVRTLKANISRELIEAAAAAYRDAIRDDSDNWQLRWRYAELLSAELKDDGGAIEQCRWVLDRLPHFRVGRIELGDLLSKVGNLDSAIAHYLEAVRINPSSADAQYSLGLAYQRINMLDKAVERYSRVLRIYPGHPGTNTNLGAVLYWQGKIDKAIEAYRKALLVMPGSMDIHFNLGVLLYKQGRSDEAIKELREALRIDPGSADIRKALDRMMSGR